jgi:hypothetical protein
MPTRKQTRGRAKQKRPDGDRSETAERDPSPQSAISSVDVIPLTQQDPLESQRQPSSEDEATRQQKKRVRVSKKEIPEYRHLLFSAMIVSLAKMIRGWGGPLFIWRAQVGMTPSELRILVVPMREVRKLCAKYALTRRVSSCQCGH